ncbi:esterase B1 isoform X1 [Drosophila willistoni]|uniref:esterase B1 isoform X1 n=1 Tax=Drosophila willistoni TaxID=7260 RepID=UPI001F07395C|nr:esterase B1 isoform X1 [Drosophila willistoni]
MRKYLFLLIKLNHERLKTFGDKPLPFTNLDYFKKVLSFKYEQRKLTTAIYSVVKTKLGTVRGVKRNTIWGDSYYSFEKIPFAKPPVGELRFKAPEPIEPWDRELDCTSPADKPLQTHMLFRKFAGSEDCLYLNVYAKDLQPQKLRPVMVWIYGGGFQVGEASRDMHSPDFFMSKDVVVVTVAYRLGALGFLSLDDSEVNVPGNAGLKDQLMGLRWVQQNIEAFGGDPQNVTLFGESAGGASTHLLTLSPKTEGLMHKAIVMSGSALCPWAVAPRNDWAYRLAEKMGYTGSNKDKHIYEFLKQAKGGDIVKASATVLNKDEKHHRVLFAFGPVIEPYVTDHTLIDRPPYELMQQTWTRKIPVIFGGTSFEGLLFYPEVTRRPATLNEVGNCLNVLPRDLGSNLDSKLRENYGLQLKRAYFGDEDCNQANMMKFLDLESYREFWHPIYRSILSRLRIEGAAPTYLYRFDFDSKLCNSIRIVLCGHEMRGACHGDDLCYVWHSMLSHQSAPDSPEYQVIKAMVDIFTNFAAHSDPNCESIKSLKFAPMESEDNLHCLNISDKIEIKRLPELEKLSVWNGFYSKGKL